MRILPHFNLKIKKSGNHMTKEVQDRCLLEWDNDDQRWCQ